MGGERESYLKETAKSGKLASSSRTLRFHESDGYVHFHDDQSNLKAAIPVAEWWKAWEKLRTQPNRWEWIDSENNTIFGLESSIQDEPLSVNVEWKLEKAIVGDNYRELNKFTKRK